MILEAGATAVGKGRAEVPRLGAARRRHGEDLVKALLVIAALVSVLTTTGIVLSLVGETIEFFGEVGVGEYLLGTKWTPLFEPASFGVLPLVAGTFLVTGIAMLVAIPLGLAAAIYLSEYAGARVRKTIKPVLELLAGVPTVVFGYFALTFFTPEILRGIGVEVGIFNALSAGIIVGFLIVPTVASISEDAMTAVPASLREGAFGLGASKLQVTLRVVFPAALSGIVASIVLGVSRAVGETMVVLIAAGLQPYWGADPREPAATMTAFIGATAKGDVATGSTAYKTIFAVGTTLFVITLVMNLISIRFVRRYRQVYE
ncbi:MAG TPA: phosphate ABC transporter permease subunit PstC [Thermoleophilaceae bacterium]|nr:phosphate ABC transporter permease subunit PstC [Thermoleophilaceae bacterium]